MTASSPWALSWMLQHTRPLAFSAIVWWVPSHRTILTRCCDVVKSEPVDLEFQIGSVLYCFGEFFNTIYHVFQCRALFHHGQRVSGDRYNLKDFLVQCVNPDRMSFELPSPSADEPSVQPSDARKPKSKCQTFSTFWKKP